MTSKDYQVALKSKLVEAQNGIHSSYFIDFTPSNIKTLCELRIEEGLNADDKHVVQRFFKVKEGQDLMKAVRNFDSEKLKTLQLFAKRDSYQTNIDNLELLAILLNFQPRPLKNFLNKGTLEQSLFKRENLKIDYKKAEFDQAGDRVNKTETKRKKRQVLLWIFGIVGIVLLGYWLKQTFAPTPQCMQWQGDHYEMIACDTDFELLISSTKVEPYDEDQFSLKRISICDDSLIFFKGGKPVVWYYKINGKPEFFDGPGYHPVLTSKMLKPITHYMIEKYANDCDE